MNDQGSWVPKDLPIETGVIASGAVAVSVRVFMPIPEGFTNVGEDVLCRPYKIDTFLIEDRNVNIIAVSVGPKFLASFAGVDVVAKPGEAVVVWILNRGSFPAAFKGSIRGHEWRENSPS